MSEGFLCPSPRIIAHIRETVNYYFHIFVQLIMGIYQNVMKLCEERGISPNKLDIESGIGRGNVERWKTVSPSIEKVSAVADYFGVSVDYIVKGEKPSSSDRLLSYAEARLIDDFRKLDPSRQSLVSEYVSLLKGHEEYIKTDLLHPEEKIGG